MLHPARLFAALPLILAACTSSAAPASTQPGPDAPIPVFAADDARVNTAGFVAETLRLHLDGDGVRYTLMAFVVGDKLTLGAMVKGSFRGTVRWRCGARELSRPFDSETPGTASKVTVGGEPPLWVTAQGAGFRGTAWTNVELPVAGWIADGTPLQLTFVPAGGREVVLPYPGLHYCAKLERR